MNLRADPGAWAAVTRAAGPLAPLLIEQGFMVLDGGLATQLEAQGCDLRDDLWSARVLLESPDAMRTAHESYLTAGADVIATGTYQATFEGFRSRGIGDPEIARLLEFAVDLACDTRDEFWSDPGRRAGRMEPLVAASVGPYGAMLADGSEYRGDYGLAAAELYDFHARRWEVFAGTRADLLACETTPSCEETIAYCRLAAVSGSPTWISFQCRDAETIADGTPIEDVSALCEDEPNVVAIGINCTDPQHLGDLIERVVAGVSKPVLAYPNSGETWDAERKTWTGAASPMDWAARARAWWLRGASGLGGCCRVGPGDIATIRATLVEGS